MLWGRQTGRNTSRGTMDQLVVMRISITSNAERSLTFGQTELSHSNDTAWPRRRAIHPASLRDNWLV